MPNNKQAALNLSDVGIVWNGESFYFKVRTPTGLPNKPEAPYFAICNMDFTGTYINSSMFKCSLMLKHVSRSIYYGSGSLLFDSGFDWVANTWYDCEIVIDPGGGMFSIYMNSVPIIENFPAGPGQAESFIVEGDTLASDIFYIDDFQIGDLAAPLLLKDVRLTNTRVMQ
jgi:hypothetical protein